MCHHLCGGLRRSAHLWTRQRDTFSGPVKENLQVMQRNAHDWSSCASSFADPNLPNVRPKIRGLGMPI